MGDETMNEEEAQILEKALIELPIFQDCPRQLIHQIAQKASCRRYEALEEVVFSDQVPMLVVLSGTLRVCIGCAPDSDVGPGGVMNVSGMLGLHELAEPFKPKAGKSTNENSEDLEEPMSVDVKTMQGPLKDEVVNIYNLCPISCGVGTKQTNLSGWLRMDIKPADDQSVKVAMLTLDVIEPIMHKGEALKPFHSNLSVLTDHFICILRHGIFPGVPPEVIWLIACGCQRKHYYPRDTLVEEDDLGEAADWLIAINSGKADVEKLAYNGEEAVPQIIGTLTEGAVLGDVCFLHGMVPRGATVRAQTEVDAIAIPPSVILDALALYPGITGSFMGRLREIVKTSVADLIVQKAEGREKIDWQRNGAFTAFGFAYLGIIQWFIYVTFFTRLCPQAIRFANLPWAEKLKDRAGQIDLVKQTCLDNFVHYTFCYFPVFYVIKEGINTITADKASTTDDPLVSRALKKYWKNAVQDNLYMWSLWVPFDLIIYAVPIWMRLPLNHGISLAWTMILSALRGNEK